jgi:hypothetical protein
MNLQDYLGRIARIAAIAVALTFAGAAVAQQPPAPQAPPKTQAPATGQTAAKPEDAKKPDAPKPGEDKTFDEVVKDMEIRKGLFTFYYKADENKYIMEIQPEQLDKVYLFAGTMDQGIGERGLYGAQQGGDFPFVFHRIGKSVQWIQRNTSFTAPAGSPAERFVERSYADAIMGAAKILSKPHPDRKSILIDPTELFLTDLPGLAVALNQVYQPTNYRFDKGNSTIGSAKTFPENILLDITLHFVTDNPRTPSVTLADQRSIPFLVRYELSALKDTGFKSRLADDRVGHFLVVRQDYASDMPSTPYVRYITRWQLEKQDPSAKLSPPKQPIVFWMENTIPTEYRDWVREGALLWNKAFERIGIQDAIVVKQQPDNADWEAGDTRYTTLRWFAGIDASFAVGYSRANPYTGQIYNANIGLSEGIFRFTRRAAQEFDVPTVPKGMETEEPVTTAWSRNARYQCTYAQGLVEQADFASMVLDARGEMTKEVEQQLMHEYVVETVAHEVGHTLGLRHNFRASTMLKTNDLYDLSKTEEEGQTASVMDYNPIVVAPKGTKQGHFLTPTLGPYDYWAIEYAYKPITGDEKAELGKIASRVADPMVPYATDEDALGTTSPQAVDPNVNQFDHSSDPIAYFKQRYGIVDELWSSMDDKLVQPGEGYQILRRAVGRGLNQYSYGLLVTSKFIGGLYNYRDHAGDPNGRMPFKPVPAARQREALDVIRSVAFSEKSFQFPAAELNKLAEDRLPGLDFGAYFNIQRLDYPWHDAVLGVQRNVLTRLYHPIVLGRIQDNELRFAPNEKAFTMADLFQGLDSAIWSELGAGSVKISSLRRNAQREQLRQLIRMVIRPAAPPAVPGAPAPARLPEDATTLARASLVGIQTKIKAALAAGKVTDVATKAHLEETQARITAALQAQMQKPIE